MLNVQSSKHSFQEENTLREDPDEAQLLEELRAKYVRLRELLNMEQRRP